MAASAIKELGTTKATVAQAKRFRQVRLSMTIFGMELSLTWLTFWEFIETFGDKGKGAGINAILNLPQAQTKKRMLGGEELKNEIVP